VDVENSGRNSERLLQRKAIILGSVWGDWNGEKKIGWGVGNTRELYGERDGGMLKKKNVG